ncbi:acid phosphatase 1-like [Amaranthus tricolor]|uniref:acid phosphatase 1-like n=1 Tax=Amaranthus tricolor TaxID=29722 RepID=UPI00258A5BEF|nr:acid phosphatase 1-like [Amaranthus tricolor]
MHLYQNHRTFSLFLFFSLLSVTTSYSLFPKNHLLLPPTRKLGGDESLFCESWRFAVETNNVIGWSTIPSQCFDFVKNYINGDRYFSDSLIVAENSLEFAKSVNITGDGKDAWIFDVDETLLFNLHYYETHNYGSEAFDEEAFDAWMLQAEASALPASLSLYKELQRLGFTIFILTGRSEPYRTATEANLRSAGYDNWERLLLRGPGDKHKLAIEYKSEKRLELVDEGYRIRGNSGDQWSDLLGYAIAQRSFKLPNPMYYIA